MQEMKAEIFKKIESVEVKNENALLEFKLLVIAITTTVRLAGLLELCYKCTHCYIPETFRHQKIIKRFQGH